MNTKKLHAFFVFLSMAATFALAQGPGGGGFNPGGPGGGGNQPGGGGGTFSYDDILTPCTTNGNIILLDGVAIGATATATSLTAPSTLTAILPGAFAGNTAIKTADLTAAAGLAAIPADCFAGCTALQTVKLPASCTAIGNGAFEGCPALASVTAPGAAAIGDDAFRGCTALTSLPDAAADIGDYAFAHSGLTAVDATGLSLGTGAFAGCTALATLSNAPDALPDALCSGCTALVFDPASCTAIGQAALAGVPYDTIALATGVALSDYAFAADTATVETLLDTDDPSAFDPSSPAFLGRTLSYDTGNGAARLEAASLVDWLASEAADPDSSTTQPASYATADLETWLADPSNAPALLAYTGADLAVSGSTFLFTPPSETATSLSVALKGATDLLADDPWSASTLSLASTDAASNVQTYILAETAAPEATTPLTAFARLVFSPTW